MSDIFMDSEGHIIRNSMIDEHSIVKITEKTPDAKNIGKVICGETNSNILTFEINRFYDNVDLKEKNIKFIIKTPSFTFEDYASNVQHNSNILRFSWLIPYSATQEVGTVEVAIEFFNESYSLKTLPFNIKIEKSISTDDMHIEVPTNWYIDIESRVLQLENKTNENIADVVEDYMNEHPVQAVSDEHITEIVDDYMSKNSSTFVTDEHITEVAENSFGNSVFNAKVGNYLTQHGITGDSSGGNTYVGAKSYNGRRTAQKQPIITFTDDDGKTDSYSLWKTLHENYDVVANIGIIGNTVGGNGCMTWAQLEELKGLGFEICSHGYAHTNMQTKNEEMRRYSCIEDSKLIIKQLKQHDMWHEDGYNVHLLPNNYSDDNCAIGYGDYFEYIIGSSTRSGYTTPLSYQIGRLFPNASELTLANLKSKIDECNTNGTWLLIGFHGWENNSETRIANLKEIVEYIQSLNIPIMTTHDALKIKGNLVDSGLYDDDGIYRSRYRITNDGKIRNYTTSEDVNIVECTGVSFDATNLNFGALTTKTLHMTKTPTDTTGKVKWVSSNTSVATVNANGDITAIADGSAVIYGSCGYPYAKCTVKVALKCTEIVVSDSLELTSLDYQPLNVTIQPTGCKETITYAPSPTGLITPVLVTVAINTSDVAYVIVSLHPVGCIVTFKG